MEIDSFVKSWGWRHVTTSIAANDGMRQVYEKGGKALEVHIYERLGFTYLSLGVAEALLDRNKPDRTSPATAQLTTPRG